MVTGNFRIALAAIRTARTRSLLTMLGVIIGVASVVTIVSIGEGVKQQLSANTAHTETELITVRPGNTVNRDASGRVTGINISAILAGSALSEKDRDALQRIDSVAAAVPLSYVNGVARVDNREYRHGTIFATSQDLPQALHQKLLYGSFFSDQDSGKQVAVIGKRVAEDLFRENVPIGRSFEIRGQTFMVRGVFEEFDTPPLSIDADYNNAIFIPYNVGKGLDNVGAIQQILIMPKPGISTDTVVNAVSSQLRAVRGGPADFSVLRAEDSFAATSAVLTMLTGFMSAVACVSLIIGGVGIMNIMLVAVTERTREIGLRKAIGATNQQIINQFMIESSLLSFIGGCIGIIASFIAYYFIRLLTDLEPAISIVVIGVALLVSLAIGVLFGIMPALKASRKDPIESLRQGM